MLFEDLNFTAQLEDVIQPETERFQKKIEACLADMRSKNLLNSSITLERLTAICQQSFVERLQLAWRALSANAQDLTYQLDLAERLERYLDERTPVIYPDMQALIELAQGFADPGEPAFKNFEAAICEGRFTAFRQLRPVLDGFCAARAQDGACEMPNATDFATGNPPCPQEGVLDLESFTRREELGSSLFALEFAICALGDAEFKQKLLPAVRALRSALGREHIDAAEFCRLVHAAADEIATKPDLDENYADLKTLVAELGIELT